MESIELLDQILNDFSESKNQVLNNLYKRKYQEIPISLYMSAVKKLVDKNLLEYEVSKGNTKIDEWSILSISIDGKAVIQKGGYEKVYNSEFIKNEEKENLEVQQLRTNVQLLTNQLVDYEKYKRITKANQVVSLLAMLLSAIAVLIEWIRLLRGN